LTPLFPRNLDYDILTVTSGEPGHRPWGWMDCLSIRLMARSDLPEERQGDHGKETLPRDRTADSRKHVRDRYTNE
jgi:hypothetical protein